VDLGLTGKKALVTGGSRGIGKAVAFELAREGADVVVGARDAALLAASASEISEATGRTVLPVAYDATEDASVRSLVDQAVIALGGIDILVNAAARPDLPPRPTLAEIDDDRFFADVNTKVMGYLRCIREVAPQMAARGGGRIVNIGGLSAFTTGSTIGSMRNISVAAMTKALAEELAPQNIRLTVVHPSMTRTERTNDAIAARAAADGTSEAEAEAALGLGSGSLLGRLVTSTEVASVVAFLASDRAAGINGDSIAVTGGLPGVIHY
jgi:NAD(P)-dependent dehydrogenase (short-subunit alcohol dehydrogenase family)